MHFMTAERKKQGVKLYKIGLWVKGDLYNGYKLPVMDI